MLRPVMRPALRQVNRSVVRSRFAYNLDGIDDIWTLANRGINVDQDIDIEFYTPSASKSIGTIISQNISANQASREFMLWTANNGTSLRAVLGGSIYSVATVTPSTKYKFTWIGNTITAYSASGQVLQVISANRGLVREPSAITIIGASTELAGAYGNYFLGIQRDIKINGVLWKMDQRNQAVQPSIPSGNNMTGVNLNPDRWVEIPL